MTLSARTRRLIAYRGRAIVAILGLIAVLAFVWAGAAYTTPQVETVTEQTNEQTVRVTAGTSAIVTGNTSLYESGERLRNKPVYFINATPRLRLHVRTDVPDGQSVNVTQRVLLEKRAVRDGRAFWESTTVLNATERSITDGEATTTTTINLDALAAEMEQRRLEIGTVGTTEVRIHVETTYETDSYSGTLNSTTPVRITERAYWLDGDIQSNRTHATTVRRQVERPPEPTSYGGPALLGVLALVGAVGVAYISHRGIDIQTAEVELSRSRYSEWISRGAFPTKTEKTYVRVDSLEDLVDIAIDSNKRVIHDEEYDAYAVVDGDLIYFFALEEEELETWLTMNS